MKKVFNYSELHTLVSHLSPIYPTFIFIPPVSQLYLTLSYSSFIEKTPVGSPSARRLTRSIEKPVAEARDLRKRSKTGTGNKTPGM